MDPNAKIVFIHQGRSWYLPYALHQARHASPGSEIVLLGQDCGIEWAHSVAIEGFAEAQSVREFKKVYVHQSTNPEFFELICFLRWFYLLEYMRSYKVNAVFCNDSDVLLFSSMREIAGIYGKGSHSCALLIPRERKGAWSASGGSSYWTIEALELFCDFMMACYHKDGLRLMIKEKWEEYSQSGGQGGINDMTILYLFWRENREMAVNLGIDQGGSVIDANINYASNYEDNEYETAQGRKKVVISNGRPMFVRGGGQGGLVRAHVLHFAGQSKCYMPQYYSGPYFVNKTYCDMLALLRRGKQWWSHKRGA